MPMGPGPLGFVYFVGVKFAGYSGAAFLLKKSYSEQARSTVLIGAVRTAIGIATGISYFGLWTVLGKYSHLADSTILFFLGFLPLRIGEWVLLLYLFFDRTLKQWSKDSKSVLAGTVWSYCLDAIGVGAMLVAPGGMWVC